MTTLITDPSEVTNPTIDLRYASQVHDSSRAIRTVGNSAAETAGTLLEGKGKSQLQGLRSALADNPYGRKAAEDVVAGEYTESQLADMTVLERQTIKANRLRDQKASTELGAQRELRIYNEFVAKHPHLGKEADDIMGRTLGKTAGQLKDSLRVDKFGNEIDNFLLDAAKYRERPTARDPISDKWTNMAIDLGLDPRKYATNNELIDGVIGARNNQVSLRKMEELRDLDVVHGTHSARRNVQHFITSGSHKVHLDSQLGQLQAAVKAGADSKTGGLDAEQFSALVNSGYQTLYEDLITDFGPDAATDPTFIKIMEGYRTVADQTIDAHNQGTALEYLTNARGNVQKQAELGLLRTPETANTYAVGTLFMNNLNPIFAGKFDALGYQEKFSSSLLQALDPGMKGNGTHILDAMTSDGATLQSKDAATALAGIKTIAKKYVANPEASGFDEAGIRRMVSQVTTGPKVKDMSGKVFEEALQMLADPEISKYVANTSDEFTDRFGKYVQSVSANLVKDVADANITGDSTLTLASLATQGSRQQYADTLSSKVNLEVVDGNVEFISGGGATSDKNTAKLREKYQRTINAMVNLRVNRWGGTKEQNLDLIKTNMGFFVGKIATGEGVK